MNADPVEQYFTELQRVGLEELNERLRALVRGAASDPAQASLFREDGVVIREALVPRQLVDAANAELDRIDDLVRDSLYSVEDFNLEADGGGWRGKDGGTLSHRGKLRKIKNLFDHGEAFKEIAFSQELVGLITAILGGDGVELHSKGFLMNKPPGVVSVKDLHQDSPYFPASDDDADVLTAWIPLQRTTGRMGPSGSYRALTSGVRFLTQRERRRLISLRLTAARLLAAWSRRAAWPSQTST